MVARRNTGTYKTIDAPDSYCPNRLLNRVQEILNVKSDAAMCAHMRIDPGRISRIRTNRIMISPGVIIRCMDAANLTWDEVKSLAGITAKDLFSATRNEED